MRRILSRPRGFHAGSAMRRLSTVSYGRVVITFLIVMTLLNLGQWLNDSVHTGNNQSHRAPRRHASSVQQQPTEASFTAGDQDIGGGDGANPQKRNPVPVLDYDNDEAGEAQRYHNRRVPLTYGLELDKLELKHNSDLHYANGLVKELHKLLLSGGTMGGIDAAAGGGGEEPMMLLDDSPMVRLSIFVSLVSYRDTLCRFTMRSLFSQALNPGTISVGVVEQHSVSLGDPLCAARTEPQLAQLNALEKRHSHGNHHNGDNNRRDDEARGTFELLHAHVKVLHMPPQFGKGPAHARYMAASLYEKQAYFLMIDSHCVFARHWDRLLIEAYLHVAIRTASASTSERVEGGGVVTGSHGPVLSQHPPAWFKHPFHFDEHNNIVDDDEDDDSEAESYLVDHAQVQHQQQELQHHQQQQHEDRTLVPFVCSAKYEYPELGFPILHSSRRNKSASGLPELQPFVGAGLLFTKGEMVHLVPFDPHLPYLFHGEEILLAARLWTHGFDFYAPNDVVLRHYYYRRESAKYHNDSEVGAGRLQHAADVVATIDEESQRRHESLDRSVLRVQYLLQSTIYRPPWERKDGRPPVRFAPEDTTPEDVKVEAEVFGLGLERSLNAFWKHVGVDPVERLQDMKLWCCLPGCVAAD